jgi:hypothetical protein
LHEAEKRKTVFGVFVNNQHLMKKANSKNAQRLPTKTQQYAEKRRNSKIVK